VGRDLGCVDAIEEVDDGDAKVDDLLDLGIDALRTDGAENDGVSALRHAVIKLADLRVESGVATGVEELLGVSVPACSRPVTRTASTGTRDSLVAV
jgi:hypothetical protein